LAISNVVQIDNTEPLQAHLQLTDKPSEMRVLWNTGKRLIPEVEYGITKENLNMNRTGYSTTYSLQDFKNCQNESNAVTYFIDPGYIHDVVLTNLLPQTRYYFRYGSNYQWSKVLSFVSPSIIDKKSEVSLVAFGDLGTSVCQNMRGRCVPESWGTTERIKSIMKKNKVRFSTSYW